MRKFITLLMFACSIGAYAQNGNMIFFTEDNENFTLMINGITVNSTPSNNVRVDNKPSTMYKVFVKFQNSEKGTITDNVSVLSGMDKTFVIKPRSAADIQAERVKNMSNPKTKTKSVAKYMIRVFSTNASTVNAYQTDPNFNQNGGVQNNNSGTTNDPNGANFNMNGGTTDPNMPNLNINMDPNGVQINGGGINFNASTNGMQTSSSTTTTTTTTTTNNGYNTSGATWSGCVSPMSAVIFATEKKKVSMQTTEAGKVLSAKKIINTYCATSQQITELCKLMYLSKDRLEFAKFAYPKCYDPANYDVVYTAFMVNSDVQDLNNFITTYGGGQVVVTNNTNTTYNPNTNNQVPNNSGGYVPGYNGPYGCPYPMNQTDYNSAKESIKSKSFESTKLEVAKQVTGVNCLTAEQIKGIVQSFDFEASKLEYAKYAYTHCYDKNNYYKVNDAFDFEASITDLTNYIKGK